MKLLTTVLAAVLAFAAAPALAQTAAEVNAELDGSGYTAREAIVIEAKQAPKPTAAPTDLDDILSAVFPGIDFTVVQNGTVNYVELAKGGKKARTGIGSGTVGELIGRLNGLVKYLGG